MTTEDKLKIDDFTRALAECINQAQCAVIDPMAHAEIWKKELLELAKGKEPVSEDLDIAIGEYCSNPDNFITYIDVAFAYRSEQKDDIPLIIKAIKFGANWQKEQFEKNRLKHCNSITNEQAELEQGFIDQHLDKYQRMPTFLDAIEYGMNLQKEQLMAKVIDARCFGFQGAALFSFRLPSDKYLVGSEVKVIVIKED